MSLKYRDSQGSETPVAGLNGTSGELVPSVALYQQGTVAITASEDPYEILSVTFSTPMPDNDYIVVLSINGSSGVNWHNKTEFVSYENKTTTGFRIVVGKLNDQPIEAGTTLMWQAFKLMTDTVHEADSVHIAQNTANFAPAFSDVVSYAVGDYVTYNNVLYRCTTAHTAGVWVAGHFTQVTVGGDFVSISKLHTMDVQNNQTTLDRIQRLKNILTANVTDYGNYIIFIELAGDDYGQIVLSRRVTTDVVRGTATVGSTLYVISGTMNNLVIAVNA